MPQQMNFELMIFYKYALFDLKKYLPITMAFLKLTINQIMYSPDNVLIPLYPSSVFLRENKLMYINIYMVFAICQLILKLSNSVVIHNYIFEIIYQSVCPLIDCKKINSYDIRSETINAWEDLKLKFNSLCQPKQFVLKFKDNEIISMNEILGKRWAHIDNECLSVKEEYLHVLDHLMKVISILDDNDDDDDDDDFNSKHNITSVSMGLQRWNQNLSSEPQMFKPVFMKGAIYTDEIRSALHFQFAMWFLTPEGLSRHFRKLQENAWRCHPLYSPDRYSFRPPHCVVPEPTGDTKTKPELTRSTTRIFAAGQTGEGTSNPSPLLSNLDLEARRPPGFRGPPANEFARSFEEFWKQWNAPRSDAKSRITSVTAQLEVDFERLMSMGVPAAGQRLAHEADWDQHLQAEPGEHQHIGTEALNEERIALDRHDSDMDHLQHDDEYERASNDEAL